ncbi:uncharacterized protein LOC105173780 [Sesamum indicum]|uniref:Uncharacterized protein LOC105173780 n=1 Tax=Sesamum indicum TaxID=4182 RepID=A0A6I9U8W6_SESIN|nr:uncharacterized protein LOC105173780 [Sesamum indicum]
MKASLTLREDPKNPIVKAKIPLTIFGVPFSSRVEAGDYKELCISFSTAFRSGPLLRFSYRPNDSCRQFGVTLRTGIGKFGSPAESPISISAEFNSIGNNCRPSFLLQFKPRSGDFSVRSLVESPQLNLSSENYESLAVENVVVSEERLTWNQLFSRAYGVLTEGEMRATTSVPVNHSVVRLGWSMKFLPPVATAEGGGGGSWAEFLSKELPYLVLRKIAVEHVPGQKAGMGKKMTWQRRVWA